MVIIAVFQVKNNVFFWDTIQLGARHALWFYQNNFGDLTLPAEIDSGHPPVFGMYLALVWKGFGISLAASHFAMLPFLLGIVFFAERLARHIAGASASPGLLLLLAADPVLAAQCLLVSPDIWLMLGFLMGLYGILSSRNSLKAAAALLLSMTSMRGMMVVVILFLFEVVCFPLKRIRGMLDPRNFFRKFLPYLPSALFAFAFLLYHYMQTGWIGYHAGSPWAPLFERVGPSGWLFNTALLGWRMVDFGRIFVWITAAALFWRMRRSPAAGDGFPRLAGLYLLTVMVLAPSLLLHRHLMLHRYLLPAFTALTLLAFHLVAHAPRTWKLAFFSLSFAGLLSGNAWIYPPAIAQGWDATLAHLPYYEMRSLMLKHIEEKGIPYEDIGTAFPEIGPLSYRDLSGRMEGMAEKDLGRQHYIFYSNIMNDFSDAERESLERSWKVLKKLEKRGIKVILYGR